MNLYSNYKKEYLIKNKKEINYGRDYKDMKKKMKDMMNLCMKMIT
jgi:hypothetical protein